MGQPCFEDKLQELNSDFAQICISPKPSGAPIAKVPLNILKDFEQQSRQNLSTINFIATFNRTSSACNSVLEKSLSSARSSYRKTKNQILDGADPRKVIKRGYDNACEYFDIMEKRILIQQRSLAALSKSLSHILERVLYTMGNSGLLRREAEMTLLHPHLGDLFICLFGVLRRFQHCTGHITTGSWKGRGNQYIKFARVLYCKLPTNGKQLPAFPLTAMTGIEPRPQWWEARVLPLCHRGPPIWGNRDVRS